MAIVQDKTGYLWFGTRDGLNKFDGQKFIVYRHIATDDASLSNNNVHSIYEDDYGNLWIGTQAGLNRYNPRTDNFTRYRLPKQGPGGPDAVVRNIIQVNSDLLWAATDDGIIQIHIKSNRIERIIKPDGSNALSNKSTRYFLKTKDGAVWICNTQFIDVYNLAKKTFRRIPYPRKSSNNIHFNDLPTLYIDRKNTIWLGYEQGLAVYNAQTGIFNDFEMNGKIAVSSAVRSICEDLTGNLWIGSYGGLYILNAAHSKISHIVHDDNSATSLSQNSIYKVIRDSRGDMWLGTWADGLNYYNKDIGAFKSISFGNVPGKLNYKVVSGIAEDLQGKLWIGTEGGGLNVYDKNSQRFSYFKHEPDNPHSLAANNVKSVITAGNGRIWLGMHDGGVDVLDPSQQPFRFKKIDFSAPGAIPLKGYKV
ncbi:MAG TPA: two-component regulator propeller domain-containing protein, partial [Niabella sp.]|nr:two-component regulator propeller domain-containing protein [Niabella sp.]